MIRLKRIYEAVEPADGERYLVERLWPRGIRKEAAHLAGWLKDLAPSPELRKWYSHQVERWPDFQKRYEAELRASPHQDVIDEMARKARRGTVTFVYAAHDEEHNSAVLLKRVIEGRKKS